MNFNKQYPKRNILWLCEKKSILIEQFDRNILKQKGYYSIFKKFLIINYSKRKSKNWYSEINCAQFWNKPILLIIK